MLYDVKFINVISYLIEFYDLRNWVNHVGRWSITVSDNVFYYYLLQHIISHAVLSVDYIFVVLNAATWIATVCPSLILFSPLTCFKRLTCDSTVKTVVLHENKCVSLHFSLLPEEKIPSRNYHPQKNEFPIAK